MLKIKMHLRSIGIGIAGGVALLTLVAAVGADSWAGDNDHLRRPDSLYVGDTTPDASADTVKRFAAITGKYQGFFVQPAAGGLHGPRGLIFNYRGDLLVSNQNVFLDISGDVLRFDGRSGAFKNELVASGDPNAPFAPQGIALSEDGRYLFVTDLGGGPATPPPGATKVFTAYGAFVGNLIPPPTNWPQTPTIPALYSSALISACTYRTCRYLGGSAGRFCVSIRRQASS